MSMEILRVGHNLRLKGQEHQAKMPVGIAIFVTRVVHGKSKLLRSLLYTQKQSTEIPKKRRINIILIILYYTIANVISLSPAQMFQIVRSHLKMYGK